MSSIHFPSPLLFSAVKPHQTDPLCFLSLLVFSSICEGVSQPLIFQILYWIFHLLSYFKLPKLFDSHRIFLFYSSLFLFHSTIFFLMSLWRYIKGFLGFSSPANVAAASSEILLFCSIKSLMMEIFLRAWWSSVVRHLLVNRNLYVP